MIKFEDIKFPMNKTWITSDTHAYHKNISRGVSTWDHGRGTRDFDDEIQMTQHLVEQINKYVKEDHLLIHDGDWSFGGKDKIELFFNQLNCKNVILTKGNHDQHIKYFKHLFLSVASIHYLKCEGKPFMLCHYPMAVWHQSHKGIPLFFGHVHGSHEGVGKSLDVGVDNAFKLFGEYRPFSLQEAFDIVNNKEINFDSHHNEKTN